VALPSTFASPSEIHSSSRGPFSRRLQPCRGVCSGDQIARAPPLLSRSGLLSWGCQISPLRRHRAKRPLPVVTWLRRAAISTGPFGGLISKTRCRPSAWSCQTPNSFRPCRSSRLRRFTPLDTSQVFCALHPTMGFATFQDSFARLSDVLARSIRTPGRIGLSRGLLLPLQPARHLSTSKEISWFGDSSAGSHGSGSIPGGATPFEAFPSPTAVPRHRGRCPLAVPLRFSLLSNARPVKDVAASFPFLSSRPQGLAPSSSPLCLRDVSATSTPDAPMGFFTFPVHLTRAAVVVRDVSGAQPKRCSPHHGLSRTRCSPASRLPHGEPWRRKRPELRPGYLPAIEGR